MKNCPELTVVIPVRNEEAAVESVVYGWKRTLEQLVIDHVLWICNDGSSDRSAEILAGLAIGDARVLVVSQPNRGHGPTIIRGYVEARGDWVLQVDGDGEIDPREFEELWSIRDQFDLLLGYRIDRIQPWTRRIVSLATRIIFRVLFGDDISDPNIPFRLFRRDKLQQHLARIPATTVAPNVALSGLAVLAGLRICEVPVQASPRLGGSPSLRRFRLLTAAWAALRQTLVIRWSNRDLARAR